MILIIGGAYQGKRDYATATLGAPETAVIGHAETLIREMMDVGQDPVAEVMRLADGPWRDAVVLLQEVGGGVVPLDAAERAWREAVGRCGAVLAAKASKVIRVFLGIGTVIKGA